LTLHGGEPLAVSLKDCCASHGQHSLVMVAASPQSAGLNRILLLGESQSGAIPTEGNFLLPLAVREVA
jgi:hypothetical protein